MSFVVWMGAENWPSFNLSDDAKRNTATHLVIMADMTANMTEDHQSTPTLSKQLDLETVDGSKWDETAHLFDNVCQEQLHVFAAERWPQMEIDCLHFKRAGELVAGCLIMHRTAPLGLGGLAVCKWGPMVRDAAADDAAQIHDAVIEQLNQIYAVKKRMMLSILPRPRPAQTNFAVDQLLAHGFKAGSGLPYPNRYFVNVDIDDDAMRSSFGQKWRAHLKKSETNGLEFEHCDVSRMPVFYDLYKEMTDRKQFPDYSAFDSLHFLMENIEKSVLPELFLVHHEGEPVAGGVIFTAGDTAVYLYGATSDKALPLR
ncbi:lipid II:glycine glycyltransferase FemX, partial [Maritalea sp.]|uniref:lipid II:glycine glycyltransferase FemX n=1 Tax=Maritalea sp. TaxID=2003361 RepID=UPI003EF9CD7F